MTFIRLCTFKHYSLLSSHVLSKLLLGTFYVPGTVLSVVDLKVNIPCFLPLSTPMYKNPGDTDLIPSLGRFRLLQSN